MRHQKHGRKFGRPSAHRKAMWSNMVASLIEHGRIETTDAKAKELRGVAERTINQAVSLGDILTKDPSKLDADDKARRVHAIRMARRVLKQPAQLKKLFDEVGPALLGRPGGYTRVLKLRIRRGDAAPISIIELLTDDSQPSAEQDSEASAKE